ncbi:hypothetical protein HYT01_02685 [Candidatus Giovannonibacteria bacterium]|nr:hypothetical protein [Candidatus Giovannonibacteria bacterium]
MEARRPSVLSIKQFDLGALIKLYHDMLKITDLMKTREGRELLTYVLKGYTIGLLFWQPSSRTFHSFLGAAYRLGAAVGNERGIKAHQGFWRRLWGGISGIFVKVRGKWVLLFSSEAKDAYFEDEIRAFATSYDALVLRTGEEGMVARAERIIRKSVGKILGFERYVPVVNAGDGTGEHPIQALKDLFAILLAFGWDLAKDWTKLRGLTIAFINDNRFSRTVHSLAWLLGKHFGMKLIFISPKGLEMPRHLLKEFRNKGIFFTEHCELQPADIYYDTRPQYEYYGSLMKAWAKLKALVLSHEYFKITKSIAEKYGVKLVLHPFPRSKKFDELPIWDPEDPETETWSLDTDERAGYFLQMALGTPTIMALLKYILNPYLDFGELEEERLRLSFHTQCLKCRRIESESTGWSEKPYVRLLKRLAKIPLCGICLEEKERHQPLTENTPQV